MAQQRTPPELNDDAIGEILLRIPPDSSAHLVVASKVCKLWRRIISDSDFTRRYSELHPTPPLLGILSNTTHGGHRFFPTMAACPFPRSPSDCNHWWRILDCRCRRLKACDCHHGHVLLRDANASTFHVWDPITDGREKVREPHIPGSTSSYAAMVLCAAAGCDHSGCHGGPFLVVFVGTDRGSVHGCMYSSESRAWGTPVSLHVGKCYTMDSKRGALAGDDAFFTLNDGDMILKYELGKNCLCAHDGYGSNSVVMPTDEGSLGLACIRFSNLCLWSRKVNPKGFSEWVQGRVIRLDKLLPITTSCFRAYVIGFAEGVSVIFVRTESVDTNTTSTFMIELKSRRVRKVQEFGQYFENVLPFMSFYTPGSANSTLPLPVQKINHS